MSSSPIDAAASQALLITRTKSHHAPSHSATSVPSGRAAAKRIGAAAVALCARLVVLLLIGGFLCATLVRYSPGYGVSEEELDSRLNAESREALKAQNNDGGLLNFYVGYWNRLLHGDLGTARSLQAPVTELIRQRSPETLTSAATGVLIGWGLGLPLAIAAVMTRSAAIKLSANLLASSMLCIPAGVLALLCILWQVPGRLVLGLVVLPKVFEYSRKLLARSAAMPHVITATAKGVTPTRILLRHIIAPALPQLIALGGISISLVFAAAIPVEVVCDIPGLGQLAWNAALGRDLNLLVIITLMLTAITLLANSVADLFGGRKPLEAA
ncbi:ABC transporter permease [Occallatibacter savannae]|uniref:ABC transporter permease n=1 Tax=Occallatibacter savannae TaxID=1002691 RepID=UPI0013A5B686|nr:ABC transporter permease [Occallatibacter savannae]